MIDLDDLDNRGDFIAYFGIVAESATSDITCDKCVFKDARGVTPCLSCTDFLGDNEYFTQRLVRGKLECVVKGVVEEVEIKGVVEL